MSWGDDDPRHPAMAFGRSIFRPGANVAELPAVRGFLAGLGREFRGVYIMHALSGNKREDRR
jgi:hypothetical protein